MLQVLSAQDRGHSNFGWLDSHHTFSFGDWYEPGRMGFRALRVINDDRVEGGEGFGSHPHRDMEILSYVLEGALAHKDSMGTGSTIRPGDVQRMSAGTGVVHSEFNASPDEEVHFLQIWLLPEKNGIKPSYEQKTFAPESLRNTLRVVAAKAPPEGAIAIHQDVTLYAGRLDPAAKASLTIAAGRHAFVHVARGEIEVNGQKAVTGDGVAMAQETAVSIVAKTDAEVLVFDLA